MVEREVLDDGLTLLFERVPGVRSASIGVWLRMGSRHEPLRLSGICHFIEHLLFKGTQSRSARDISLLTDRMGGNLDAFTSKEMTCFYSRVLDEHLGMAVELLADIVRRPLFEVTELERERQVILEEIRMVNDSPEDRIYDLFSESFWPGNSLGRPIQGTLDSVSGMSRRSVQNFFRRAYVPENMLVSVAGHITSRDRKRVRKAFSGLMPGKRVRPGRKPRFVPGIRKESRKELEQVHLLLGVPGLAQGDDDRFTLHVLNTVLGGSISSRLFRRIREERGLAYSVSSHVHAHEGGGLITVYAGTSPDRAKEVLSLAIDELRNLAQTQPEQEEVDVARDHLKGNMLLALESTTSRMSRAAREEMVLGRHMTTDEIGNRLDAIDGEQLRALAEKLFAKQQAALAVVGNSRRLRVRESSLAL